MRICFVTKYPPIEGGVSMHCYWAARGLAERGHQVFVVTNADEVEDTFRIHLEERDRADGGDYAIAHESGGSVTVLSSQPQDPRRMYYIPMGNPVVTKLATAAADVVRRETCDVIFAYYLEPYGVAAHLASTWTGVPYVFKHAGSDLHRLMELPELRGCYLEVLRGASRIISRGPSRKKLLDAGITPASLTSEVAFGVPLSHFHPTAAPLTNGELAQLQQLGRSGAKSTLEPLSDEDRVLGIYGKLGEYKGTWDLLRAMGTLHRSGFRFHLLALSHGWQEARFHQLAAEAGVVDYVHILPFIPTWRVPSFIRRCTAVAFLERQFPISAHTPTIPAEVVCCGTCLVLSEEVARKQLFRPQIRDGRNLVVVPDPTRHSQLADRLEYVLRAPARAAQIGLAALEDFGTGRSHQDYVDQIEQLFAAVATEGGTRRPAAVPPAVQARTDVLEMVSRFYPYTHQLLDSAAAGRVRNAVAGLSLGRGLDRPRELALAVGHRLEQVLREMPGGTVAAAVCQYERKVHDWGPGRGSSTDAIPSIRRGVGLSLRAVPRLYGDFELVTFEHDVERVMAALDRYDDPPGDTGQVTLLFHQASAPLRINGATQALIDTISGKPADIADLVDKLRLRMGLSVAQLKHFEDECRDVVEGLYWEGVVDLHDPDVPTGDPHNQSVAIEARL